MNRQFTPFNQLFTFPNEGTTVILYQIFLKVVCGYGCVDMDAVSKIRDYSYISKRFTGWRPDFCEHSSQCYHECVHDSAMIIFALGYGSLR